MRVHMCIREASCMRWVGFCSNSLTINTNNKWYSVAVNYPNTNTKRHKKSWKCRRRLHGVYPTGSTYAISYVCA